MSLVLEQQRLLAPLTTLGLGGNADYFVVADKRATLVDAVEWARGVDQRVYVLGAGSNVVVADTGVHGLVVQIATRGLEVLYEGTTALVTAQAGEPFQALVECAIDRNLSGLECLYGIPGLVGATPVQNVGAYGQEVSDTIDAVEVLDLRDLTQTWLTQRACDFGYRNSVFKREPGRFIVLAVRYRLGLNKAPSLHYPELKKAFEPRSADPSLRAVADMVWALRATKSMVLVPSDENCRSAGSFFTNPLVTSAEADRVCALAVSSGLVRGAAEVPCFGAGAGLRKLAAGWLIERAGIAKGFRKGSVGVSSRHALSLVHHGGGTATELLSLASEIQARVMAVFGIALELEPVCWG